MPPRQLRRRGIILDDMAVDVLDAMLIKPFLGLFSGSALGIFYKQDGHEGSPLVLDAKLLTAYPTRIMTSMRNSADTADNGRRTAPAAPASPGRRAALSGVLTAAARVCAGRDALVHLPVLAVAGVLGGAAGGVAARLGLRALPQEAVHG